jgi:hypothetical protein
MEYGICLHSVIPVRSEPSHKSEMVTQILFGELYHIIFKDNAWFKIRMAFDGYEGWVNNAQANILEEIDFLRLVNASTPVTIDLVQLLSHETGRTMIPVILGRSLPGLDELRIRIGQDVFYYEGGISGARFNDVSISDISVGRMRQQLIDDAMLYMNSPYLWGGRTPFGIDCSGFVQMAYKLQGLKLSRDASQQAAQGDIVSLLDEAEMGDLAFFDDPEGNITHVGIIIDRARIMHCSGKVHVDTLDHEGIYSSILQKYTHKLRLLKRIIPA